MGALRQMRRHQEQSGEIMRAKGLKGKVKWLKEGNAPKDHEIIRIGEGKDFRRQGRHAMSMSRTQGGIFRLHPHIKRLLDFDTMDKRHEAMDKEKALIRAGYRR